MIWYALLFFHVLIMIFGVISHLIFLQLFVFREKVDGYGRINLGIMSMGMLFMIVSYFAEILTCLSIGSVFEDAECNKLQLKIYLICLHRFNEMISLLAQWFFAIERVLSIQYSHIHNSQKFRTVFIFAVIFEVGFSATYMYTSVFYGKATGFAWYLLLHVIIIANFPPVYYAKRKSMAKFTATVATYSLRRKHELFNYYETARSLIYSTAIYLGAQLVVFSLVSLHMGNIVFPGDRPKLLFINNIIWNSNLAAFPWIVLLFHRTKRERICKIRSRMCPKKKERQPLPNSIIGVTGRELVASPTQTDYFDQLKKAWG